MRQRVGNVTDEDDAEEEQTKDPIKMPNIKSPSCRKKSHSDNIIKTTKSPKKKLVTFNEPTDRILEKSVIKKR